MVVRTCLQHAHLSFSSSTTNHRVIRTQWQQLALNTEETLTVKKRKRKKLSCSSRQTTNNFQSSLLPHTTNSYCTNNFQLFVQSFEIFKSKVRMFPLKFDGISFIHAHGNDDDYQPNDQERHVLHGVNHTVHNTTEYSKPLPVYCVTEWKSIPHIHSVPMDQMTCCNASDGCWQPVQVQSQEELSLNMFYSARIHHHPSLVQCFMKHPVSSSSFFSTVTEISTWSETHVRDCLRTTRQVTPSTIRVIR